LDYISLSKEADKNFGLGKYEEAKALLEKGLSLAKKNGNKSFIEFFLGELQNIDSNYESAVFHHKNAVELAKKSKFKAFFLKNLGVSLSLSGRDEEAIECYDRALEIKPDDYNSLGGKGVSLGKLGRDEEAIECYDRALEIKPDDYNSLRNKGVSLGKLGREEEAIECYDRALEIKPDDYYSLGSKGVSLGKLGREEEAIEWFDRALEIKSDDYNFLRNKGVSLGKLRREEEAIEWFDRALEIKPDDYDSLRNKGVSLSWLKREEEAIECYDRALEIKPDDWNSLVYKALSLEVIGKNEEATQTFDFIARNEDKIKDKEIIEIVNFKKNALKEKEKDKKTDVLNEVINAFQEKKDDFFKSINNIESRFQKFIDSERSIPDNFFSFLSVLRKWNSYTPILPSEKGDNKGGGYFLYHRGKGIVIDPGFNFIENFYQEGFKVADIDAVLITHAHNDHTVDLESILTLVYKHNDAIDEAVRKKMKSKNEDRIKEEIRKELEKKGKKIDLFMNEGTFMKYSGWLNLKDSHEVNNVTVLMPNTMYELPEEYKGITIHTTKAKHHEVIDEKYAIGFILDVEGTKVGFTGDTGWDWDRKEIMVKPFLKHNPRLVIAHLGSIKSTEFDYVKATCDDERNKCFYRHHLGLLGMTKFLEATRPDLTIISEFGEELRGMRKPIVERISKVMGLNCLPGDIGLYIRLSDLGVYCFVEEDFVDYKQINVYSDDLERDSTSYSDDSEKDSTLCFHRSEPDHKIFNKALSKKRRSTSIPLCKRIKSYR